MSRPKMKKVAINRKIFQIALKYNNLSIRKLAVDNVVDVNERTIRRALNAGEINPDILNKIAKRLNVDPYWLTGETLKLVPSLENRNPEYMHPKSHPYNECMENRKNINISEHFEQILNLHGIPMSLFNKLPETKQNGFHMELDLIINLLILKYFSDLAKEDNPFLRNKELVSMATEILSGDTYNKMFEILEL